MERSDLPRNVLTSLACAAWVFLLVCLGSFHPTDWPSHAVAPYPPVENLCGKAGAFIAYYSFLAIGHGVFPLLFFTGVCLVFVLCKSRIGDVWMRVVGLLVLAIAFAAAVHHLTPGSSDGLPEGRGGIIGIGTAAFLNHYFSTIGTRLILMTTLVVGLLLAADDLVFLIPAKTVMAFAAVRHHGPALVDMAGRVAGPGANALELPGAPQAPEPARLCDPRRGRRFARGQAGRSGRRPLGWNFGRHRRWAASPRDIAGGRGKGAASRYGRTPA